MSSQHRHMKKTKKEGHTHLQNPLTKSTELTADKTEGIRSNKSKTVHITFSYSNPSKAINAVKFLGWNTIIINIQKDFALP
jgi:hypothetical protein